TCSGLGDRSAHLPGGHQGELFSVGGERVGGGGQRRGAFGSGGAGPVSGGRAGGRHRGRHVVAGRGPDPAHRGVIRGIADNHLVTATRSPFGPDELLHLVHGRLLPFHPFKQTKVFIVFCP